MKENEDVTKHFTATVFVVADSKVLLLEHKKVNAWLPPGGHVEVNELPYETAIREVKEETGLKIELINDDSFDEEKQYLKANDPRASLVPRPWKVLLEEVAKNHYHIDFLYLAKTPDNKLENRENHNMQWFTVHELEENKQLFPNVRYYGIKAIKNSNA